MQALEVEIAEAERIAGDVDSYNSFCDGYRFDFTFQHEEERQMRRFLSFMRTDHPGLAKSYVRNWSRRANVGNSYPVVRYQFGDFEGWFMTEEGHREQAIIDGIDETIARTSPWLSNQGTVATNRWILAMDRCIFDLMEAKQPEEIPIRELLEEMDPSLARFVDQAQPWWINARFSG